MKCFCFIIIYTPVHILFLSFLIFLEKGFYSSVREPGDHSWQTGTWCCGPNCHAQVQWYTRGSQGHIKWSCWGVGWRVRVWSRHKVLKIKIKALMPVDTV